jgi:hypothetical protein
MPTSDDKTKRTPSRSSSQVDARAERASEVPAAAGQAATEIFGTYEELDPASHEYLQIGFSPTNLPLQQRWRNNGLSANFLADYITTFFPGKTAEVVERREEVRDAVSYIANELLENAMKFSHLPERYPVEIRLQLESNSIRFYVTNSVAPDALPQFRDTIQRLLTEDPERLYMERLAENIAAGPERAGESGLGFLTMLNNYNAQVAWKLVTLREGTEPVVIVTTMVHLAV